MTKMTFDTTPEDRALIKSIVDRALRLSAKAAGTTLSKDERAERALGARMDLTAAHANGCPLDLPRLYAADDFNLMHDVSGISRHLDRDTGKLVGHFLPRFAQKEAAQ